MIGLLTTRPAPLAIQGAYPYAPACRMRQAQPNHSYELPEIIALPITAADSNYLKWLTENSK